MNRPLLSIIILVRDLPQLFSLTMDSILSQTFKDFEIIVIDQLEKEEAFDAYSKHIEQLEVIKDKGLGEALEAGFEKSKGKYIQFLLTGDRYLGTESLSKIFEEMEKDFDLIFCSYIKRALDMSPFVEKISFTKKSLMKGVLPSKFQCIWFKADLIRNIGGINVKYYYRPNLDLLSKIFSHKKINIKEFNQVIVDCEMRKKTTTDLFKRFIETFRVIRCNFGYLASIKWLFTQNYINFFTGVCLSLKKIFYRS
jgi:glycosyltransferase involved in cell wall biosynthesis